MPPPLRVVIEASALNDGRATAGIGRYVRSLSAALQRLDGVEVVLSVPARPARSERHPLRYLHAQPRLLATALSRRPHLVHAVTSEPVLGWPLGRQVVTVHDVIPWTSAEHRPGWRGRVYFQVQAARLRRCAAIIAVSPSVADDVITVLGIERERVIAVPEGVDPVFQPQPVDDGARRGHLGIGSGPYVLWAGSMLVHDPRKALDTLLDAMARLHGLRPDVQLVMAGRTGAESERLSSRAAANGVRLHLPGFVSDEDLAVLYRSAAVSVLPSHHEGFGLPVLEAMACGAPVVAAAAGNLPELAGDAALLVPPGDASALADALIRALDPDVARELRERGPRRAATYTWDRCASQTLAVYLSAARRPARTASGAP